MNLNFFICFFALFPRGISLGHIRLAGIFEEGGKKKLPTANLDWQFVRQILLQKTHFK